MISKKLNSSDVDWGENNSTITNKSVKNLVNQTKQRKKTTIPSSLKKKKKKGLRREGNTYTKNKLQRVTTTTTTQFVYVYFPKRSQSININIDWSCPNRTENTAPPTNLPSEWRMTRSWDEEVNVHTIGRFSANSIPQARSMTDGSYQTDCGVSGLSLRVEVKSK